MGQDLQFYFLGTLEECEDLLIKYHVAGWKPSNDFKAVQKDKRQWTIDDCLTKLNAPLEFGNKEQCEALHAAQYLNVIYFLSGKFNNSDYETPCPN